MPYVILAVIIVAVVYFVVRGLSGKPDPSMAIGLYLAGGVVLFVFAGIMAIGGRLTFALPAFFLGLWAVSKFLKERRLFLWRSGAFADKGQKREERAKPGDMSRTEALEVLGLKDGASRESVRAAYKRLMTKMHPDAEGSDYLAQKINQARDTLLNK